MTSRRSRTALLVLTELAAVPGVPLSGTDLHRRTGVRLSTLYPLLTRLEGYGWLSSAWEDIDPVREGRPRRRLYRLTEEGVQVAAAY